MRSWSHLDYLIKLPDMIKDTIFVPVVCPKRQLHEYMEITIIFVYGTQQGA